MPSPEYREAAKLPVAAAAGVTLVVPVMAPTAVTVPAVVPTVRDRVSPPPSGPMQVLLL